MLNVGDNAPDFAVKDHNGNIVKLSDYSGKSLVLMDYTGQPLPGDHTSKVYHLEFGDYHTLGIKHLISYGGNYRHARFDDINLAPKTMSRSEGGAYIQDEILLSEHFRWISA